MTGMNDDWTQCWDKQMDLTFPVPINSMALEFAGADCEYTVTGFDSNGQVVDTAVLVGIPYTLQEFGISSAHGTGEPIAEVAIHYGCGAFVLDTLTWTP